MGLEGTRLWTSLTEIESTPEVPAETIPATMTDGRAELTASPDSFLLCSLPAGPDVPALPAVGHPLFACTTPVVEPSPEIALRSFSEELARFESLLEDDPEAAAASLDSVECLAERIESLSTRGLSDEALRDRSVAVLQTWSLVRAAVIRISERTERPTTARLNDTAVTDRMRAAARDVVERVTEIAEPSAVEGFETRLDAAIDEDDREFLAALTPETVSSFLATHEMATALSEYARESEGEDRLTASLESARLFGTLGLEERVTETLGVAEAAVRDLPEEADFLDGFLSIAGVYQEAGMIDEANRALLQVSFVGENSLDPASRERGAMAHAMQLVNRGELREAEEIVAALPESEATTSLLEGIREGLRRQRVIQNLQLFQGFIVLYSETHEFAEGTNPEEVRAELLQALQTAAATTLSGETPNLWQAFGRTGSGRTAGFLFDSPYGSRLESISDPALDPADYQFRVLELADGYMEESEYTAAGIVAEVFRDDPALRDDSAEYFRRIEYHTSRASLSRSGADFVGDLASMVATNLGRSILDLGFHVLSLATLGLVGGSIEDDILALPEIALIVASEGLSVEAEALFSTSRFARGLSPLARGATRWAVREGTMATAMGGGNLLINAARERSLEGLTLENFGREFGANLVLFSLCHFAGRATEGAPLPVRWGAGVGSFVAADYVNEGIGFRDESEASFGLRLAGSIEGDLRVRFSSWLGNRMSGGRFARLREESARLAEVHSEAWRASGRRTDISSWARGLVRYLPIPGIGMGFGFASGVRPSRSGTPLEGAVPGTYRELSQRLQVFSATRGHDAVVADLATGPYARTPVAEAILNNPNLRPRTSVRIGDRTFYLGPVIRTVGPDGPRSYSLGVVPILEGGAVRLREVIFYRSNSDGGWRVTPARLGGVLMKGRMRIGAEARGHYTAETQLAPELSQRLEALEGEAPVELTEEALDMLINIESPLNAGRGVSLAGRFADQQRLSLAPGLEPVQRFAPGREMFWRDGEVPEGMDEATWAIVSRVSPRVADLGSLPLPEGFVPDFSAEPLRTYEGRHTTLGDTTYREYRGTLNGREVVWTMAEAEGDRVWVQSIRYAEAQVTDFGTFDTAIDTGILTSKPVEYSSHLGNLPEAYRRPILDAEGNATPYEDITPLLAELAPIRSYREARASREGTVPGAVVVDPIVAVGETDIATTIPVGPPTDITSLIGTGGESPLPSISPDPSLPPPGYVDAPVREERGTVREPLAGRATARPPTREGRVADPVRPTRYMDLPAAFRSFIDRIMIRASAAARRAETGSGGSIWSRDNVFTRRMEDGTLVIAPTSEVARADFLEHLSEPGGPAVEDLGSGRYRVTVDGQAYDLRVRLDGAALRSVVDGMIAEGMNQAEIESRLAEEGLTPREAAEVIGPRISRAAGGGRSGEGSL